jgi:hypothetical protein
MDCAAWLARRLASVDYRAEYAAWRAEIDGVSQIGVGRPCGVLAQSERCANSVLVKRIIRASGVLRGLTSCRYGWPMVGGTLQSVTSHESVLLVDAALL